ncbi:G patch domain and ankyrin repeat-containing protein 1 homolog [Haematobia irritans]|uniref:G patch domain and ankyrin repeat-containing protein 1 homolog n=1 Tax=Haematobia irritans TaxID=7368 RepID=UPI003F50A166
MNEDLGEQFHPNWRALATVHIPLKRFIKEGTEQTNNGTHNSKQARYEIQGVDGGEIKEFYEELTKEETVLRQSEENPTSTLSKPIRNCEKQKETFSVVKYQRYAMDNDVEKLKGMDFRGQDINVCDNYGWTALMIAACEGNSEAVSYLLDMGVDSDIKDKAGNTAKDLARKKGHFHIEKLMETVKRNINSHASSSEDEYYEVEPFFCDTCKRTFSETTRADHLTSTIHQFNVKSSKSSRLDKFNIPERNKGLQLMVKQGWDKESGLGPSQSGRLYPVKTVIRKKRTGLGIEQEVPRVTHFQAYDKKAVQRDNSDYYKKKPRNRNDIRREKIREWKRDRRIRNALN